MTYKFDTIRVLVIDDNKAMMDLMKSILRTFGVGHVLLAKNADDGFNLYLSANPDLIITDWMIQPYDGIELTRKIRTDKNGPNPFVPIILMTGFSEKRRVISARDSGITEFLAKPFNVRDLYRRIHEIIENPRQFVNSDSFFGPDRRRKDQMEYNGPSRRHEEISSFKNIRPEDIDFSGD